MMLLAFMILTGVLLLAPLAVIGLVAIAVYARIPDHYERPSPLNP